jgi:hypothetical protein
LLSNLGRKRLVYTDLIHTGIGHCSTYISIGRSGYGNEYTGEECMDDEDSDI